METRYDLPVGFLSFGTVQFVSAMMLAHHTATNERLAQGFYLRTDSRRGGADGVRIGLYWRDGGLCCGGWDGVVDTSIHVGGLVGGSLEL